MHNNYYERISKPFRNEITIKIINILNKSLTTLGYISYPILLFYVYIIQEDLLIKCILIPGIGFVLLSFIRKLINRKRPYETFDIKPLIQKDTKGKSMPSRHVFSMSIIAVSWFHVIPSIGVILIVCSIMIAFIRFIGGVHYLSDVVVGFLSAIVWGLLFLI